MGVSKPMDVKFHTAAKNQLWVANYGQNGILVLHNPQDPSRIQSRFWKDRAEYHYNDMITALGFDDEGETVVACLGSRNTYYGMFTANQFMGPTVYEVYPVGALYGRPNNPVASVAADGGNCTDSAFPNCYLVHSDMLHESPECMGAVHDPGAITQGGLHVGTTRSNHVYFYSDGLRGELLRFDAESLHGPGTLDHRSANIRRYSDVRLKRVPGVPGHMVLDRKTRILYVADPGNSRVIRVLADGGKFKRVAQCVPDECYPDHESYIPGSCKDGYCAGNNRCTDSDGYGCYHIFTETADLFEYELWGCSTQDVLVSNLELPSGLVLHKGRLFVGNFATGSIHVYALDGTELGYLPVSSRGLTGLELACEASACSLFFANAIRHEVGVVNISNEHLNVPTKPLVEDTSCSFVQNLTRPAFNVTHGPGYQNTMVVKYSYGKHCDGYLAGEDVELSLLQVFRCPDRTDCQNLNGDALLMAGYLCHPCLPNPCAFNGTTCQDLKPYRCHPGFHCSNNSVNELYCGQTTTSTQTMVTTSTTTATVVTFTATSTSTYTNTHVSLASASGVGVSSIVRLLLFLVCTHHLFRTVHFSNKV